MAQSLFTSCFTEFIATFLCVITGLSIIANDLLPSTKGKGIGFGWIAFGFGMAFVVPLFTFSNASAHVNPAIISGLFVTGKIGFTDALALISSEICGGFCAGICVYLLYYPHFQENSFGKNNSDLAYFDEDSQARTLMVFATKPAIYNPLHNFFVELLGTAILTFGLFTLKYRFEYLQEGDLNGLTVVALHNFFIGVWVFVLVLGLGGPTGFSANPARDFGPRLAHWIIPIPGKGSSELYYGLLINAAAIFGGIIGGLLSILVVKFGNMDKYTLK